MTGSAYPGMWDVSYEPGNLESMAEAYSRTYINCCLEQRGAVLEKVVRDGNCDGLIMHQNRSCKNMSLLNNEGASAFRRTSAYRTSSLTVTRPMPATSQKLSSIPVSKL